MLDDKNLSPEIYRMKHDSMSCVHEETLKGDQIRILEDESSPVDSILGIDIYSSTYEK